ncbi:hypothetical protein [Furfurilactobacillus entadae]
MIAVVILVVVLIGSGVWEMMNHSSAAHLTTNKTTTRPEGPKQRSLRH